VITGGSSVRGPDTRKGQEGSAKATGHSTAHRIWERIRGKMPECRICERTIRQYVHDRKVALGLVVHETFHKAMLGALRRRWAGMNRGRDISKNMLALN
jgi:hypothetical protein